MLTASHKSWCAWVFGLMLTGTIVLADNKLPLLVAYFIPKDRDAIPGYVERLDRVMTEVQSFYREGMQAAGYGPMTFDLEREKDGKLMVHVVPSAHPMRTYGRDSSDEVRDEVKAVLARKGVDMDSRTVVIFQVLLEWRGGQAREVGPYVGGGSYQAGTAWVYDDALLDPRRLDVKAAGGFYGGPCSIGEFNSHYIGGVAHELGHGFGLPHVTGPRSNPKHSLMGDGNHTYGAERRGAGSGTYLHPASAMLLARCRPFAGDIASARARPAVECADLRASFHGRQLLLEGKLDAAPPAFGVAAYNDRMVIPADYDATGWTSPLDDAGCFKVAIGDLEAGDYELRLLVCHTNGATSLQVFRYAVSPDGVPDLSPFSHSFLLLSRAVRAYGARSNQLATALLDELHRDPPAGVELSRQVRHLRELLRPRPRQSLAALPKEQSRIEISQLEFTEASVGWGSPLRDQVLSEDGSGCFLQVDGAFRERGLYAHAPSRYVLDLAAGGWKRFTSGYGLQDGHAGSVIFVIRADRRELFRSNRIHGHKLQQVQLDIRDAKRLELVVEDAGDGPTCDWGVWIDPALWR